jgi:hypothetical protein
MEEIEKKIEEAIMEALEEYRTEEFDLSKEFHNIAYKYYTHLESLIYSSEEVGREKALNFCLNKNGDVVVEGPYTGEEYGVVVPECRGDSVSVGGFHTHPKDEVYFSPKDIVATLEARDKFACVGAVEKDVIITEWARLVELPIARILCIDIDYQHPMFEEYASKLLSVGKRLNELEESILEYVMNGKEAPENLIDEYVALCREFEKVFAEALEEGVFKETTIDRPKVEELLKEAVEEVTQLD